MEKKEFDLFLTALRGVFPFVCQNAFDQLLSVHRVMNTDLLAGKSFTKIAYNLVCIEIYRRHVVVMSMTVALESDPSYVRTQGAIGVVDIFSPSDNRWYTISRSITRHPDYYKVNA